MKPQLSARIGNRHPLSHCHTLDGQGEFHLSVQIIVVVFYYTFGEENNAQNVIIEGNGRAQAGCTNVLMQQVR